MTSKLKHWLFDYHLIITFALVLVAFLLWTLVDSLRTQSFLFTAIGAVFGLSYFALKQHFEETQLFKDLFATFNHRFDEMNERLYAVCAVPADQPLTSEEEMLLYDYFNLCAEEYLYFSKGYIYPEVWLAWRNGMKIFCKCPRICDLWAKELKTGSYYGFKLPCS